MSAEQLFTNIAICLGKTRCRLDFSCCISSTVCCIGYPLKVGHIAVIAEAGVNVSKSLGQCF